VDVCFETMSVQRFCNRQDEISTDDSCMGKSYPGGFDLQLCFLVCKPFYLLVFLNVYLLVFLNFYLLVFLNVYLLVFLNFYRDATLIH